MRLKTALIIFMLLSTSISYAQEQKYYADIVIEVDMSGNVEITGISNHPQLQPGKTQIYTSKKGNIWTLNITAEGIFSDFVYELRFPPTTLIKYLKTSNLLSIGVEDGYIIISGIGTNEEFMLIAQYSFRESENYETDFLILFAFIILFSCAIMIFSITKRKKAEILPTSSVNLNSLTERQRKIFDVLLKNPQGLTQAEIQKLTGIPKASLSRNINSLCRKGLIAKEEKGMSNFIYLKKNA